MGDDEIGIAASAWLEIGLAAVASGDRPRAVAALMAIGSEQWEAIRNRLGDELFAALTASVGPTGADFEPRVVQNLALLSPSCSTAPADEEDIDTMSIKTLFHRGAEHAVARARTRLMELTEQAAVPSAALAKETNPVIRAALMASLAGIESETARWHELAYPDGDATAEPGDAALPQALRCSAVLLRLIAFTEDAPEAAAHLAGVDLALLVPDADVQLLAAAATFLDKLAATADPAQRADLLFDMHAALVTDIGPTAAETLSWLGDLADARAGRASRLS